MAETGAHEHDLEIEVGHGTAVELRSLSAVAQRFSGLIDEVAKEYTGIERGVKWVVEVERGCVKLPLRAEAAKEEVRPGAVQEVGSLVADGLSRLEQDAARPDYFNDKALEQAKGLANLATSKLPLAVRNGRASVHVTQQLSINAEKVLGTPRETIGTIEGRLESLYLHGPKKDFRLWPPGSPKGVKCLFGGRIDVEHEILPAVMKRVAARGKIKTRPNGERLSVEVHELRVLGEDPIDPNDVRGILSGYEAAEW